jgi:hypothetical protein
VKDATASTTPTLQASEPGPLSEPPVSPSGSNNDLWAAIMSRGTDIEKQSWVTRQKFPEVFITEKWAEGFNLTSLISSTQE